MKFIKVSIEVDDNSCFGVEDDLMLEFKSKIHTAVNTSDIMHDRINLLHYNY